MKNSVLGVFLILLMFGAFLSLSMVYIGNTMLPTVSADEYNDSKDSYDSYDSEDEDEYDGKDEYDDKDEEEVDSYDGYQKKEGDQLQAASQNRSQLDSAYDSYSEDDSYESYDSYDAYDEYEDASIVRETINNPDGTTTNRYTKTEGSEISVTEVTYDANGNKIMEKKMEKEGEQEEFKLKFYDIYGQSIAQYELKSKNGAVVKIEYEEDGKEGKVKYNAGSKEFVIEFDGEDDGEVKIKSDGEFFRISKEGSVAFTSFPMQINEATGDITITTSNGDVVLKAMPDNIMEKATENGDMEIVEKIELDEDGELEYRIQGIDFQKLLGIFTVEIPVEMTYNAQTGDLLDKSSGGFFSTILNFFSF